MNTATNLRRQVASDLGISRGISANNSNNPNQYRIIAVVVIAVGVTIGLFFTFKK